MARRFRFELETLLKVRRLREREAKRKVAAQQAEIARLDRLEKQTQQEISRCQAALRDDQKQDALDLEALVRGRAWIAHLHRTTLERQATRGKLVDELENLQTEFRQARTQTRILEKLRDRRWDQYVHDRKRREQAEADELARQLQACGQVPVAAERPAAVEL